ncbi:hypothetical protein ACHAPG_001190 [Botrytis cinerea]
MNLLCDDDSSHDGPPSKRQKTAEIDSDDFENNVSPQSNAILLNQQNANVDAVFIPSTDTWFLYRTTVIKMARKALEKNARVALVLKEQYEDIEISDHLPLSHGVRHDLACHFRVIREVLSKMFSTKIEDMRKRMARIKIESMPVLQEETSMLQKEIVAISGQIADLGKEARRTFTTVARTGENISGALDGSSILLKEYMPKLVHLSKGDTPGAESLEEEVKRLKTDNARLEAKIQQFEGEKSVGSGMESGGT